MLEKFIGMRLSGSLELANFSARIDLDAFKPRPSKRRIFSVIRPDADKKIELYGTLGAPAISVPVPPGILKCFERVRFQAVYLDPQAAGTLAFRPTIAC